MVAIDIAYALTFRPEGTFDNSPAIYRWETDAGNTFTSRRDD
jgi:hypothetical protein